MKGLRNWSRLLAVGSLLVGTYGFVPSAAATGAVVIDDIGDIAEEVDGGYMVTESVSAVLGGDVEITKPLYIAEGGDLKIDLANHTLRTMNTTPSRLIMNYGTLTITSDQSGTLMNDDSVVEPYGIIDNYGTLNVTGSNVNIVDLGNGNGSSLKNRGGTMNVESGSLRVDAENLGNAAIYSDGVLKVADMVTINSNSNRAYALIVNSGEATIGNVYSHGVHGGFGVNSGKVTVNGGDYASENYYGIWITNDGETTDVTINGGNFTGKLYGLYTAVDDGRQDAGNVGVVVNGGNFYGGTKGAVAKNSKGSERDWGLEVKGGKFTTTPEEYVDADNYVVDEVAESGLRYNVRPKMKSLTLAESEVELAIGEEKAVAVTTLPEDLTDFDLSCEPDSENPASLCYFDKNEHTLMVVGGDAGTDTLTVRGLDGVTTTLKVKVDAALATGRDEGEDFYGIVDFETPVEGGRELKIESLEIGDNLKAQDAALRKLYDIKVLDADGNEVAVSGNKIKVMLLIDKESLGDYKYFQVVYVNDEGKIAEWIDVDDWQLLEDSSYVIAFTTTHLSSYGILAANEPFASAAERNAANEATTPDTGVMTTTEGGVKGAGAVIAAIMGGVMGGLMGTFYLIRKRKEENV